MIKEKWYPINNYEGLYEISNLSRIRGKNIRIASVGNHGYYSIDLYKNNKRKTFLFHRLVAETFIPKIKGKEYVNHKNGNKLDNSLSNLEWCTQKENVQHSFDVLRHKNNFQTNHPKPSLGKFGIDHCKSIKVKQLDLEGQIIKVWNSGMDAVRDKGFLSSKISECCSGKRKTHAGFKWEYAITR